MMKVKGFSLLASIALLLFLIPISATKAQSIHTSLNSMEDRAGGQLVTISGSTSLASVVVKVLRPNRSVLYMNVLAGRGAFSDSFTLPATASAGVYTVYAGKGTDVATTDFQFNAGTPPTTPLKIFGNKIVTATAGTGTAEISAPPSDYTQYPDFAAEFNDYFNQKFSGQPQPLAVVTPASITAGNQTITQNSSQVTLTSQQFTGNISIANSYGAMSIGDSSQGGTTAVYGGSSCQIGPTANLIIYGDIVCKGPLTFKGNIDGLVIHGNVIAEGGITFNSSVGTFVVEQSMSAQGSIVFKGSNITNGLIKGDLIGHGISFNGFSSLSVSGNVSSTKDFMPSKGNYRAFLIGKSLYVSGDSQFSTFDQVSIQGSYYGKGDIHMRGQIANQGLTVGESMLSNGSIHFHGISGAVSIGGYLGALNELNFHNMISTNLNMGGLSAGIIQIFNNYAPANIHIHE